MSRLFLATVALASLSLPPCNALAREATPPGSFLRYRAATVQELLRQVSTDQTVRGRYARHFRIRPDQVRAALSDALKLVSLKKPTRVRSWYVGRGGKLHVKSKLLPKGTLVYVGTDGKPLLAWSCGNPLRTDIPRRVAERPNGATSPAVGQTASDASGNTQAAPTSQPTEASRLVGNPDSELPVETKVLPQPVETVGVEPISAEPGLVEMAEPMVVAQALPQAGASVLAGYAPTVSGGGISFAPIAGLAGALAGIAAIAGHQNSPSSTAPDQPVPVPEPTGLAVMAAGALATAWAVRGRGRG